MTSGGVSIIQRGRLNPDADTSDRSSPGPTGSQTTRMSPDRSGLLSAGAQFELTSANQCASAANRKYAYAGNPSDKSGMVFARAPTSAARGVGRSR